MISMLATPQTGTFFLGQMPEQELVKSFRRGVDESGMRLTSNASAAVPFTMDFEDADLRSALAEEVEIASMLRRLGSAMGAAFHPKSLPLPGGGVMELDGYSPAANIFCEVVPHVGAMTADAEDAAMVSALKLLHAAQVLGNTARLMLLFRDRTTAQDFCASRRARNIIEETGVEVRVLAA